MSTLSRRSLVTSAAALPAMAVPAAVAGPASVAPACTLPPELIDRFVPMRALYLDRCKRDEVAHAEIDRRFYAATGVTSEQRRELDYDHPRRRELDAIRSKIYEDFPMFADDDPEANWIGGDRWNVAEAMLECEPRTVADIAWQAEAYLLVDMEIVNFGSRMPVRSDDPAVVSSHPNVRSSTPAR